MLTWAVPVRPTRPVRFDPSDATIAHARPGPVAQRLEQGTHKPLIGYPTVGCNVLSNSVFRQRNNQIASSKFYISSMILYGFGWVLYEILYDVRRGFFARELLRLARPRLLIASGSLCNPLPCSRHLRFSTAHP